MSQNKPNCAFILAAGQGKRLRPHTDTMPKPMVPLNDRPIIDYILEKLILEGITNVTINLYYLGDRIQNFFKGYNKCNLHFSKETELLNTGGGVKFALDTMQNNPFYLINGDAFWIDSGQQSALSYLSEYWSSDKMDILLLLQPVEQMTLTQGVGDYDLDENGSAVRSHDKTGRYMFAGVRIVNPAIFDNSPDGAFSFLELMDLAERNKRLYGVVHQGEWHHISTPGDLERVNAALLKDTTQRAKSA